MKNVSPFILSATILGLITAGCGQSSTTAPSSSTSTSPAPSTVVVALPVQTTPNWFFPVLASTGFTDTNSQMNFMMYKPLVYISKTDGIDYAKSLATNIQYNSSGTRYVITLGSKYRWSNGKPVTAQDVVFTWDIIKAASENNAPWSYGGAGGGGIPSDWTSVQAVGSHKVVVTLAHPANQSWFIHNGLAQIIPVPKSAWDKYPNNMNQELTYIKSIANVPTAAPFKIVDGPFQFSQMQPNNYWAFTPNPHYGGHKATIKKIEFQYETSSANEFAGLKTGTVDVGYLPPSLWDSKSSLNHVDRYWSGYAFGFNMARVNQSPDALGGLGPVFSQRYVRAALEMGIDQQGIINSFYHGQGVTEDGPVPSKPPTQFYDPALSRAPYPFNPQAGKKLLEAHGWHMVNGVMTKNGIKLAFPLIYTSGSNTITDVVQLVKTDWAKEGIQVTLVPEPFDNVIQTMHSNPAKWDAAFWGGGWTYQPDYYPTGGELFATGSAANAGHYNSTTMNRLIQASYAPGTPAQTKKALFAYEAWAVKDIPYLWFPWIAQFNETANTVHHVESTFNPITDLYYPNYWTTTK
ncbi:peptide/nickel transport system substrate-binding protein [Sulfobacillus thermosulfidooxidans DSM 9293]|uniref:Peptide/nickel transport system substrate-binding protein n=1 Tax=Sulfobacillus thermosulfidooxidans (strain DSM 9293 / VKM B-1269 / AT-1) TaxID=929705 RepID=A0A1W1WKZ6_SULTA|nr:peptide ABC transporter substrate-binding protein [Sulfobacillus thermosulfidooxidans]SMC06957.1 peptide/nickel transport system substrate-binding protein [Sulfobacillus thermosulfidooxidans DSM 9293]